MMPVSRDRIRRELKILQIAGTGSASAVPARTDDGQQLSKSVHGTGMIANNGKKKEMRSFHQYSAETEIELLNAVAGLEADKLALSLKLAELTMERDEAQDQLNDLRCEVVDLRQAGTRHDKERDEVIDALKFSDQEVERLKAELQSRDDVAKEVSSEDGNKIKRLEAAFADATSKLEAGTKKASSALDSAHREVERLKAELQSRYDSEKDMSSRHETEVERLKASLIEATSKLEIKDMKLTEALKVADQKVKRLMVELQSRDEAMSELSSRKMIEIERHTAALAEAKELLRTKQGEINDLKSTLQVSAEEVGRLAMQNNSMKEENDKLAVEVEKLTDEEEIDKGRIRDLEALLKETCEKGAVDAMINTTAVAKTDDAEEASKLKQQILQLEEKLQESNTRNMSLSHELQVMESVLASTERQNDDLECELKHIKDQTNQSSQISQGKIKQHVAHAMKSRNEEIEELRRQLEDASVRAGEQDIAIFNMKNSVTMLQKEKEDIATELERHLEEIVTGNTQLLVRLQAKEDEVIALRSDMAALRQEMNSYVATKRRELDDFESELMQKSHIIAEKERTIQSLRDLSNEHLKNTNSVKAVCEDCTQSPRMVSDPVAISPDRSFNSDNERALNDLRTENKQLSGEVSALSNELQKFKDANRRLRIADVHGSPNAANKILRKRNEQLKKDVEKATRRLIVMDKMLHASRIN